MLSLSVGWLPEEDQVQASSQPLSILHECETHSGPASIIPQPFLTREKSLHRPEPNQY